MVSQCWSSSGTLAGIGAPLPALDVRECSHATAATRTTRRRFGCAPSACAEVVDRGCGNAAPQLGAREAVPRRRAPHPGGRSERGEPSRPDTRRAWSGLACQRCPVVIVWVSVSLMIALGLEQTRSVGK